MQLIKIFMVRNLCDRHRTLKDISWIWILHQYHKASGLKACTAMCRSEKKCRKCISLIQNGGAHVFLREEEGSSVVKEYEIITLKYNGKNMQVIFVILLCTRGYNSLCDPTRQHEVWRKILLQDNSIERGTQNKTQIFNVSDQIWRANDQNEMKLHSEYDYECIRDSLSSYPVLSR